MHIAVDLMLQLIVYMLWDAACWTEVTRRHESCVV